MLPEVGLDLLVGDLHGRERLFLEQPLDGRSLLLGGRAHGNQAAGAGFEDQQPLLKERLQQGPAHLWVERRSAAVLQPRDVTLELAAADDLVSERQDHRVRGWTLAARCGQQDREGEPPEGSAYAGHPPC